MNNLAYLDDQSCNDTLGDIAANKEAAREDARDLIATMLADGDKVLFDDGTEIQLDNDKVDSFIRQTQERH